MGHRLLLIGMGIWFAASTAHSAVLAIVMAVDVSGSVSADSYILQRDGIAHAFEDRRLIEAIAGAPGGIEVLLLEWSDPDKIAVTVDWTEIHDARSAARFAATVHATTRSSQGLTAVGPALAAAGEQFARLPQPTTRRMIDISGDGMANLGEPPQAARDRLVTTGITINALAILTEEPWLEDYDRRNVIGGPGAFVLGVRNFHSFAEAMRRKLAAEVASALPHLSLPMIPGSPPGATAKARRDVTRVRGGEPPAGRPGRAFSGEGRGFVKCNRCGSARNR
jgi:Ca-activated chloride channel family protein